MEQIAELPWREQTWGQLFTNNVRPLDPILEWLCIERSNLRTLFPFFPNQTHTY